MQVPPRAPSTVDQVGSHPHSTQHRAWPSISVKSLITTYDRPYDGIEPFLRAASDQSNLKKAHAASEHKRSPDRSDTVVHRPWLKARSFPMFHNSLYSLPNAQFMQNLHAENSMSPLNSSDPASPLSGYGNTATPSTAPTSFSSSGTDVTVIHSLPTDLPSDISKKQFFGLFRTAANSS